MIEERPDLASLAVGEIRALDATQCVVRTDHGFFAFSRRCPHEGADLAYARLEDGRLRCPHHNLWFDPETGRQPCRSLSNLTVRRLSTPSPSGE